MKKTDLFLELLFVILFTWSCSKRNNDIALTPSPTMIPIAIPNTFASGEPM
jgi:hypothetical protein